MIRALFSIVVLLGLWISTARADGPLDLGGHFVQGGLAFGHTAPGATVTLADQPVRVAPDGRFLLGFEREAPAEMRLIVRLPDGHGFERMLSIDQRDYDIQRIDGLPERKVSPTEKDMERIRADREIVYRTREVYRTEALFDGGFQWPAMGPISGVYGSQRILNGEPRQPHYGVDIAGPEGAPVVAPADGIVTMVHQDMFFTGKTLIIDHGLGLSSTFLHLSDILVVEGQRVARGDPIGRIGATGRATGPHLDWRINLFQARLDPAFLVPPMAAPAGAD